MPKISIKLPNGYAEKDIKRTVTQEDGSITLTMNYPNGFEITTTAVGDTVNVVTNKPLIDDGNGTFTISE